MMKFLKCLITALLILLVHKPAMAQENDALEEQQYKNQLGVFGSLDSGFGISYRTQISERTKIQISTLPFPISFFGSKGYLLSLGFSAQGRLFENKRIEFYGYLGNHFLMAFAPDPFLAEYIIGIGPGLILKTNKRLYFQIQAGVATSLMAGNDSFPSNRKVFFSPGIGLLFGIGKK